MNDLFDSSTRRVVEDWAKKSEIDLHRLDRVLAGVDLLVDRRLPPLADGQEPTISFPGLHATPFWDKALFEWAPLVENATCKILSESMTGKPHSRGNSFAELVPPNGDGWSIQYLACLGKPDTHGMQTYPETASLLSGIPGALSCGMAYFSTLASGARIRPHSGFTNAHLRCHLTLRAEAGCFIRVGDQVRTWREGELLVFDDTFEHETWNDSPSSRLVLLFDVYHPDLTFEEIRALDFLTAQWRRSVLRNVLTA